REPRAPRRPASAGGDVDRLHAAGGALLRPSWSSLATVVAPLRSALLHVGVLEGLPLTDLEQTRAGFEQVRDDGLVDARRGPPRRGRDDELVPLAAEGELAEAFGERRQVDGALDQVAHQGGALGHFVDRAAPHAAAALDERDVIADGFELAQVVRADDEGALAALGGEEIAHADDELGIEAAGGLV